MPNYQLTESEYAELHKIYGIVKIEEGTEPTPEQMVQVFLQATGNLRLHLAWKALDMAARLRQCFMEDHAGAVQFRRIHVCETGEAAYQRGVNDLAAVLQDAMSQENSDGKM